MSPLTTNVVPKLRPTPVLLPRAQAYMLGDFMRGFEIEEHIIQMAQQGYIARDFIGITVNGCDRTGIIEQSTLMFHEVANPDGTLNVDLGAQTSVTEQLSRSVTQSILYSVSTLKRRGLAICYTYLFSAKANANDQETMTRYGLTHINLSPAPGTTLRQVYSLNHRPTGAQLTHASARPIR